MPTPPLPPGLDANPAVAWRREILRYADLDANGHLNNTAYAVFFESGRVALAEAELRPTLPEGAFFVVARLTIDFTAELFFPGEVDTGTWISRIGRTSFVTRQVVVGGGRPAALAETVCVVMGGDDRRPLRLPQATREALAARLVADDPA